MIYEEDDKFNALFRRMSGIPFAPKETLNEAFNIFEKRATEVKDEETSWFCFELIEYFNVTGVPQKSLPFLNQYISGPSYRSEKVQY